MEKCREADIKKLLSENAAAVETELEKYLKTPDAALETLYSSMRYSALGGGKRIRAFLVMQFSGFSAEWMPRLCLLPAL